MASGEMDDGALSTFFETGLQRATSACADGALIYWFVDRKGLHALLTAGTRLGLEQMNLIVWLKEAGGMGSFYRSRYELIVIWKAGRGPHINNIGLKGRAGARTNVWEYAGMNGFGADRKVALAAHPTVKPVALCADAIKDATNRGDRILDLFAGTGTTLIAAERTGRVGLAMEIEPRFCDVALRRYERQIGEEAVLLETGETFGAVAARRTNNITATGSFDTEDSAYSTEARFDPFGQAQANSSFAIAESKLDAPSEDEGRSQPDVKVPVEYQSSGPLDDRAGDVLRGSLSPELWAAGFRVSSET